MQPYLIGANIVMIVVFILKFPSLPPQIPLFYSQPWGEDRVGELWMIVLLPFLLNVFFFMNQFFAKKFFPEDSFIKKMAEYFNLFLIITLTLIFIKIIFSVS